MGHNKKLVGHNKKGKNQLKKKKINHKDMKRILLSAVMAVALLAPMSLRAQMQALFGYSTFYLPEQDRPYMETYLQFDAWTMQFEKQSNGVYRATVEVTLVARQQDSVCYVKKYDLASPTVASLDELDFSFIDVQRFSLTNGVYDIEVTLRDKGTDAPAAQVLEKVVVSYDRTHPAMSSVQPMAEVHPTQGEGNILSRNGYDMEPYVNDFYPEQVEELNYYYEVYNIDKEIGRKPFLAMAYVERQETGARYEDVQMMSRKNSAPLVPVYGSLDISKLPSGNYNLVVELRNRDGETMLYKRVPFYRSNPGVKGKELSDFATTFAGKYTDEEQLNIYIDGLYPIASEAEKQVAQELVKRPGLEEKQAFLYRFWTERNAMAAEAEWLKYKERIDYVQEHFSYPRTPGIHTDFGRVYLQYGPPDFIRDEKNYVSANRIGSHNEQPFETMQLGEDQNATDPLAGTSQGHVHYLPYQFWRYNKLDTDDPNRVFLFWDEHRSGYYRLLNSNARGEVQEIGWERRLCRQQLPEGVLGEVGEQFNRGY